MIHDIFSPKKESKSKKNIPKEKIIIDYREKNSLVPAELINQNFEVEFKELKIGDYLVKETIIERKTTTDFVQSMINKRLFKQLEEIKQYPNYLLIVEGKFKETRIHPNAIKGFILSINLNYKVPIIFTNSEEETATYISLLAKKQKRTISLNPIKSSLSDDQRIKYILQSFPNIGPITTKRLLEQFENLETIFNSSEKELKPFLGKNTWKFQEILKRKIKK